MKKLYRNVLLMLCVLTILLLTGCGSASKNQIVGTKWAVIDVEENIDSSYTELYYQLFPQGLSFEFGNNGKVIVSNIESSYRIDGDKMYVENGEQTDVYTFSLEGDFLYLDMSYITLKLVKYDKYKEVLAAASAEDEESQVADGDVDVNQPTETSNPAEETEEKSDTEDVSKEEIEVQGGEYTATAVTCMNGKVEVSFVNCSEENNTVVLRIENNTSKEITTFGLPNLVVNGKSTELDRFSNMQKSSVTIASNSYVEIDYVVNAEFFQNGGRLDGSFHTMDMTYFNDKNYSIEISRK